jgi:hypothetical protein
MNKLLKIFLFLVVLGGGLSSVFAQSNIVKKDLSQAEIDKIIKNVAEKESEFREALKNYVFNRFATIQTVGFGGQITGEFRRDSFMTFNSDGARFEKILFAPMSTLRDLTVTPEDLEVLGGVNPFAIEPRDLPLYNFNYLGKEKIDELDLYVFEVAPKIIPDPKKSKQRLFVGKIWVDDRDLQIVKSKGKAVPETKDNKFPIVETWRENIEGKYWFPAYSLSTGQDGELVFGSGQVIRLKMLVRYTNYRQGRSEVIILDDDETEETKPKAKPTPTPTPKKDN